MQQPVRISLLLLLLLPSWAWGQALSRREASLLNPLEYGVTCSQATLQSAISATPASGRVLMLTPVDRDGVACTWTIATNLTVPSHVTLQVPHGVTVAINTGIVLTLAQYPREDNRAWKTGAGRLVITAAHPHTSRLNVKDFGAVGDGVTNDRTAIQAALNATLTAGTKHVFFPAGDYYLGSYATYTQILTLAALGDHLVLETEPEVLFRTNTTAPAAPAIFYSENNSHLRVGSMRFYDVGYDSTIVGGQLKGALGFQIINATTQAQDLMFDSLHGEHMVMVLTISSGPTPSPFNRTRGIHIKQLISNDCFYGFNAANDGDAVTIDNLNAYQNYRPYFVYGVSGHRVKIFNRNPRASSAQVLISRLGVGTVTRGIDVQYVERDANQGPDITHVMITHTDLLGGEISNIKLHLDILDNGTNPYYPLRFVNYAGGVIESTAPSFNVVKDIWLSGSATANALPIASPAAYASKGLLHFQAGHFFLYDPSILTRFHLAQAARTATTLQWGATGGTQPALNNGTLTYDLDLSNGMATISLIFTVGSTTTFGTGNWYFANFTAYGFPLTAVGTAVGTIWAQDASTGIVYHGIARIDGGAAGINCWIPGQAQGFGDGRPFAWAAGDTLNLTISFPIF